MFPSSFWWRAVNIDPYLCVSVVAKAVMRQWFDDTFRQECQCLGVIMVHALTRVRSACRAKLCHFDRWRDWFVNVEYCSVWLSNLGYIIQIAWMPQNAISNWQVAEKLLCWCMCIERMCTLCIHHLSTWSATSYTWETCDWHLNIFPNLSLD